VPRPGLLGRHLRLQPALLPVRVAPAGPEARRAGHSGTRHRRYPRLVLPEATATNRSSSSPPAWNLASHGLHSIEAPRRMPAVQPITAHSRSPSSGASEGSQHPADLVPSRLGEEIRPQQRDPIRLAAPAAAGGRRQARPQPSSTARLTHATRRGDPLDRGT
jgi:hypothetical protein